MSEFPSRHETPAVPRPEDVDEDQNGDRLAASKQWTTADWLEQQDLMRDELFLAPDMRMMADIELAFSEVERQNGLDRTHERSEQAPFEAVETKRIVRVPSMKDWSDFYHSPHKRETLDEGENAVIEIARKISSLLNPIQKRQDLTVEEKRSKIDRVLREANIFPKDGFTVILKGYEGPRGPLYLVQDGSHRVAASKLLELDHIEARVGSTPNKTLAKWVWYEALVLMSKEAQAELRWAYDTVYPPTPEEKRADDESLKKISSLHPDIIREQNAHQDRLAKESQARQEAWEKIEKRYGPALAFAEQAKNQSRFRRLEAEAGLAYLIEHAPEYLWDEYKQEITADGFLVRKDGKECWTHATRYDVFDSRRQIAIHAADAYGREFPEEYEMFMANYIPPVNKP